MPVSDIQSDAKASLSNSNSSFDDKETANGLQSSSKVQFAPVPYHTRDECNLLQTHNVSDLTAFQSWLREGLAIRVYLQKATFVKADQTENTSSRPNSTTRAASSKKEKPPEKVGQYWPINVIRIAQLQLKTVSDISKYGYTYVNHYTQRCTVSSKMRLIKAHSINIILLQMVAYKTQPFIVSKN